MGPFLVRMMVEKRWSSLKEGKEEPMAKFEATTNVLLLNVKNGRNNCASVSRERPVSVKDPF